MTGRSWVFLGLVLCGAPWLAWAQGEPSAEELEARRRKLAEWRKHPEQMQKLRRDFLAFQGLSEKRQEQILKFDRELRAENPATQTKLVGVLERYVDWLEKLSEAERQHIKEASDNASRLQIIKEMRDKEWVRYQPRAVRDKYAALTGKEKDAFISKLRQEERQRKLEWLIAGRFWSELETRKPLPARLSDLNVKTVEYVNEYLRPVLSKEEEEQLEKAQGHWPLFPMTLVELADKHPPALPGANGPRTVAQLPTEVKLRLGKKKDVKLKIKEEGRWPAFAAAIADLAHKRGIDLPHELWPTSFKGLSPAMQDFVKKKLEPLLTPPEQVRLARAEQNPKWPDYPELIQELARNHHLKPPWYSLPPSDRWDAYRLPRLSTSHAGPS